jgi:hypothetical protein
MLKIIIALRQVENLGRWFSMYNKGILSNGSMITVCRSFPEEQEEKP